MSTDDAWNDAMDRLGDMEAQATQARRLVITRRTALETTEPTATQVAVPTRKPLAVLLDQVEMPGYNPAANAGRGDWGLRDVSSGAVYAHERDVVACVDHGAMNSVSPGRTLWRCLACGRAAYRVDV